MSRDSGEMRPANSGLFTSTPVSTTAMVTPCPVRPSFQATAALCSSGPSERRNSAVLNAFGTGTVGGMPVVAAAGAGEAIGAGAGVGAGAMGGAMGGAGALIGPPLLPPPPHAARSPSDSAAVHCCSRLLIRRWAGMRLVPGNLRSKAHHVPSPSQPN
jgi:hypothetical protein